MQLWKTLTSLADIRRWDRCFWPLWMIGVVFYPHPYATALLYVLSIYALCGLLISLINLVRILWSDPK